MGGSPNDHAKAGRRLIAALWISVLICACGQPLRAEEPQDAAFSFGGVDLLGPGPSFAEISAGVFNVYDRDDGWFGDSAALGGLELRYGGKLWGIGPMLGILGNSDGGVLGYGGLYADVRIGDFIITPRLSVAGYDRGDGEDLGSVFQFRSAITLSYRFENGMRLGIGGSHISNGGFYDENPGAEEVFVTLGMPLPF